MTNYILPLDAEMMTLAEAGGKGASLNRLGRAGFPVPAGFVVTTAAYQAFVAANDLAGPILAYSQATTAGDLASFEAASQAIRRLFEQGTIPAEVAEAVHQAADPLANTPLAVRSSATAEDLPEASFAGQQETTLNVSGEEALLAAVGRCWSSLWTGRAIAYRARQEIPPDGVSLAVVVQAMVPAEAAGVLFTLNPVTGNRDEMVINATWGLGEALVSGRVNPDTLVVEKATGRLLELQVGDKTVMTAPVDGGTAEVVVDEARRRQPALAPEQAAELARLGREIEARFGQPQDIEWAVASGQMVILQSRPVTTASQPAAGPPGDDAWPPLAESGLQPFDLWSQMDVGERWPEAVTPFTWSTWQPMMNENMRRSGAVAALKSATVTQMQWARRAYGRIYFNEGAMSYILSEGYGMPASIMASTMGTQGAIDEAADRWRWGRLLRRLPAILGMTLKWERVAGRYEQSFSQIDAWVAEFMERDLERAGDAELWAESETVWQPRVMDQMDEHGIITAYSSNNFSLLERSLGRWLAGGAGQWASGGELAHALITGLTGIVTAEIVPALWQMARQLQEAGLAGVVLEQEPAAALAQLRQEPAARPFLESLEAFLRRHGHRCMSEAEWLHPRWREAPEQVIESVAGYLRAGPTFDPAETEARQRRQREEATALVESRLDPLRKRYFRSVLNRTQKLVRQRDNGQHFLVKMALPMRRIYASLGRRWVERGWLADPDDFFFLTRPEIEAILQAGDPARAGLELPAIVAGRRAAYAYWLGVTAPEVLGPDGRPVAGSAPAGGEDMLAGVAASAGRVQGAARVILSPREATTIQPGEILVTRATDPGWTPVFSVIGGLVLEVGGQLSHGAIVAREYGLPAVVNVPEATRRIQDGQVITVDGTAGKVYL
ncbi:MAG: hypothetical protein L0332_35325 [Chloroflexi bacterium]|nr:hypothetical protein [Chloroflexota bacterium]MCI0579009.1 hypothetical protein [Chloroflexota bacterium]MCI0644796.1 hypothetical protein [Chloroflexota bacterium]MCI0731971.1 hypothetical protein [Chloroflexota bacterium]